MILSLALSALVSITPTKSSVPACIEALENLENEAFYASEAFIKELQNNPRKVFNEIHKIARKAKSDGKSTFEFVQMMPVVDKLLREINFRLSQNYSDDFKTRFSDFKNRYEEIKARNIPYHEFNRTSFAFMELLNEIDEIYQPELKGRFHQTNSKADVELVLAKWPDELLFWTFEFVTNEFFYETRPVGLRLIGGLRRNKWGDGFPLVPGEFSYHDLGHAVFMIMMDDRLKAEEDYSPGITEQEWDKNRDFLKAKLGELAKKDLEVAKAAATLLFEVLHERGFQYDLAQLKAQFETPRWVDVVKRKLATQFWEGDPLEIANPDLLESGRQFLLNALYDRIEVKAVADLTTREGEIEVIYRKPAEYYRGNASVVEIYDLNDIRVDVNLPEHKKTMSVSLETLSLALIPPEENIRKTTLSPENMKQLELLLWAKKNFVRRWRVQDKTLELGHIARFTIRDGRIEAQFQSDSSPNVIIKNIKDVKPDIEPTESPTELGRYNTFKIGQVIYLQNSKQQVSYSLLTPPEYYKGKVQRIRNVLSHRRMVDFVASNDNSTLLSIPLHSFFVRPQRNIIPAAKVADQARVMAKAREALSSLKYHDWKFSLETDDTGGFFLRPRFIAFDAQKNTTTELTSNTHGREWKINPTMSADQIRQTALLSAVVSAEHQVRKNLYWKNILIGSPNLSHEARKSLMTRVSTTIRNKSNRVMNYDEFRKLMSEITFKSGSLEIGQMKKDSGEEGFYIRGRYFNPSNVPATESEAVAGDEIYVGPRDSTVVVLQKALRALISASRHEVQQNFLFDGVAIFQIDYLSTDDLMKMQVE